MSSPPENGAAPLPPANPEDVETARAEFDAALRNEECVRRLKRASVKSKRQLESDVRKIEDRGNTPREPIPLPKSLRPKK